MKIKNKLIIAFTLLMSTLLHSQNKVDLSKLTFTEDPEVLIKGIPGVQKGQLSSKDAMFSYGFDNSNWIYKTVVPYHIELLSYKGKVAGYGMNIKTFDDQEKIKFFMKEKYKNITIQESKWMNVYTYKDTVIVVELRAVIKEKFDDGANGYFSIKKLDFYDAFESETRKK